MLDPNKRREVRELANDNEINERLFLLILAAVTIYGLIIESVMCYFIYSYELAEFDVVVFPIAAVLLTVGLKMVNKSRKPLISFIGYTIVIVAVWTSGLWLFSLMEIERDSIMQLLFFNAVILASIATISIIWPAWLDSLEGCIIIFLISAAVYSMFLFHADFAPGLVIGVLNIEFGAYFIFLLSQTRKYAQTLDNAIDCASDLFLNILVLVMIIINRLAPDDD